MAAVTRFGLEGYGVRRAGSFAGKTTTTTHPVGIVTRFGLEGYGVRRAGDFSGKSSVTPAVEEAPRRGGAFYPTRAEIARARRRARNTGGFVMPLSRLDRRERIEELQEEVQEAVAEAVAVLPAVDVPAVPTINWAAIEQKREFEATAKRLEKMLEHLDYMLELAQDDDDIEVLLLS